MSLSFCIVPPVTARVSNSYSFVFITSFTIRPTSSSCVIDNLISVYIVDIVDAKWISFLNPNPDCKSIDFNYPE